MLSRAWYVLGGILLAMLLAGSGYYAGHEHEADRWALARAALADSADSARARAGRTTAQLAIANTRLDSALAGWIRLSVAAPRVRVVHDTVHARSDTSSVFFGQAWWHPGLDQLQMRDERDTAVAAVKACQAVVSAAMNYRTACEAVRDSLTHLLEIATARGPAPAPRRLAVVIGPGVAMTSDGRVHGVLSVTAGWRLW